MEANLSLEYLDLSFAGKKESFHGITTTFEKEISSSVDQHDTLLQVLTIASQGNLEFHSRIDNIGTSGCKLIDAGADVNVTNDEGKTALFYAVHDNNESVVHALIDAGADVNRTDNEGRTPLFYAIKSINLASYLLGKGANLHLRDSCNMSILSFLFDGCMLDSDLSFGSRRMSQLLKLVKKHGVDERTVLQSIINVVFCKSPLLITSESDSTVVVNALKLAKKLTSHNFGQKRIIQKILHLLGSDLPAVIKEIMALLVKFGANPNSADSDGNTALHYATVLSFHGASEEAVMGIMSQLVSFGVHVTVKNTKGETPLLFCLSPAVQKMTHSKSLPSGVKVLVSVCRFLLQYGSSVEEISKNGKSIFHLILELFQHFLLLSYDQGKEEALRETMQLFQLFDKRVVRKGITVNRTDFHLNTPLHKWASLKYTEERHTFGYLLKRILDKLLMCGAKLNARNENDETPLHHCRTWTAVELLLNCGANPNDVDSSGRSPLLFAAKREMTHESIDCFYPDVSLDSKDFWRTSIEKGLDPWTVDRHGESVLSVLVGSNKFDLSKALLDVACEDKYLNSKTIAISLLNAVCKDKSTHAPWKFNLVQNILKSSPRSVIQTLHIPLLHCCRNILESESHLDNPSLKTPNKDSIPELEEPIFKKAKRPIGFYKGTVSIHWTIAKQLLLYGADCNAPDSNGLSCLEIAEASPALKELLSRTIDIDKCPLVIKWSPASKQYQDKLSKVARCCDCEYVGTFWYHKDYLARGSFGAVFAGIHEKDGREVAIKRIEKIRMQRPEDKREITNLTALADCEQVVRYLSFFEDEHFSYIVLELMEGNLDQFLNNAIQMETKVSLCQDIVQGLKFLHDQNILHRDLKPTNILYKMTPKLCLKIADFGLSRRMDNTGSSSSVYGSNVGTRCWLAPEVLTSKIFPSKSSDVFACGLILHYILSVKKHPFAPRIGALQHEIEVNILNGNMEGWDDSLCPEAANLLKGMLDGDEKKRPSADKALDHPFFWSKKKKLELLNAVGNQKEFGFRRVKRRFHLAAVETDLEASFGTIVKYGDWNDPGYVHMHAIYTEMTKRRTYNTCSVVELVRFIHNAYACVSESTRPTPIRKQLLEDFVFLEYFPNLVMEVHKAVVTHRWDKTREEIKYAMKK